MLTAQPSRQVNFFHAYPLARRCWGGTLASADFVHFSSGSSGQPTPWARCADDENEVSDRFEQVTARRGAAEPVRK
jgi:phenylacetate-CoA ligase